jgi:hypothetical protein
MKLPVTRRGSASGSAMSVWVHDRGAMRSDPHLGRDGGRRRFVGLSSKQDELRADANG